MKYIIFKAANTGRMCPMYPCRPRDWDWCIREVNEFWDRVHSWHATRQEAEKRLAELQRGAGIR
jgi:hypothetical protein